MDLSKKTTILFPPRLHQHLTRLARQRHTSIGELVRSACEAQYGVLSGDSRLKAVDELRRLSLPVGSPSEMKAESTPDPWGILK